MSGRGRQAALAICTVCAIGMTSCRSAMAISTLSDTLKKLPSILRLPSSDPPNSAVHRDFGVRPGNVGPRDLDVGPGPEENPVTVGAAAAPWAAAISDGTQLDRDFVCAGVLVAARWVLTAAHCTFNLTRRWPNDDSIYVFTHTGKLSAPGPRFDVRAVVPHPEYDPKTLQNDLALLEINVNGRSAGLPISLRGPPITEQEGGVGSILGWGISTQQSDRTHSEELQVIQTAVLDKQVCFSTSDYPELNRSHVFCGRSLLKYHNICFRFGGSPMVLYDKKANLYLAGLVSWPAACGTVRNTPNVYLDVQAYVPWIKKTIAADSK